MKHHLINSYRNCLKELRELRRYVYLSMALFVAGGLAAVALPEAGEGILAAFAEYFERFRGMTTSELVMAIFVKNFTTGLFAILLGPLLGLLPALGALANGMVLGTVLLWEPRSLFMILPHGIFELPAIFIAWGLGFWCAGWLAHRPRLKTLGERLKRSLRIYLYIALPLLAIAAVIEVAGMLFFMGG